MHCNRLVLGLGLVRVSSRVKVRVSVLVRVSIRTNWVLNFALPASNLHSSPTTPTEDDHFRQCVDFCLDICTDARYLTSRAAVFG